VPSLRGQPSGELWPRAPLCVCRLVAKAAAAIAVRGGREREAAFVPQSGSAGRESARSGDLSDIRAWGPPSPRRVTRLHWRFSCDRNGLLRTLCFTNATLRSDARAPRPPPALTVAGGAPGRSSARCSSGTRARARKVDDEKLRSLHRAGPWRPHVTFDRRAPTPFGGDPCRAEWALEPARFRLDKNAAGGAQYGDAVAVSWEGKRGP